MLFRTYSSYKTPNPASMNPLITYYNESWYFWFIFVSSKLIFLRVKIDKQCRFNCLFLYRYLKIAAHWKSANSFLWSFFKIPSFKIGCLIWWTSYQCMIFKPAIKKEESLFLSSIDILLGIEAAHWVWKKNWNLEIDQWIFSYNKSRFQTEIILKGRPRDSKSRLSS